MKHLTSVLAALWLLFAGPALGQTGSWTPAAANQDYPRTLLTPAAVPAVQLSLAQPAIGDLYRSVYASATAAAPPDNTSASGRRARATTAKNAAFVLLINRQPDALLPLPADTRTALATQVRALLETLNPAVEPFAPLASANNYNEWQWRSKELIDYLVAYDLLRGAGETDSTLTAAKTRLQQFAGNLHLQSTKPFFTVTFYGTIKNNHVLMTAAALGMAAVVLNDVGSADVNQQPVSWINTGLYHLDNVLWQDAQRQSDPAAVAGYAEGPYYFKYAFLNCLPFFRALGNFLPDTTLTCTAGTITRRIRNPYYDPRYDLLYDWITAILMPDGRIPALEDSYVDLAMPELALTGKSRYVRPLYLEKLAPGQLGNLTAQLRDATVDMRAAYLAALPAPTAPTNARLTVLPASGNLVFRSGNAPTDSYLHVYGKGGLAQANSGGHSQADASSFILHAYGQLLALDAGYLSYSRRAEVGNATNHNLVLVDGRGPAIGAPGAVNDAPAAIQNAFQTPQLAYGEVQTSYQGASITRKTLFVRNSYFLLADFVLGAAPHSYTWQLHGYGLADSTATSGSFRDDSLQTRHEGTWRKNGVSLTAHVTVTGGATAYARATGTHELTYNTPEDHTTLLVRKDDADRTQFLAALYPFTTMPRLRLRTTSTTATAALAAADSTYHDDAFAQADTVLTTNGRLRADGLVNLYSQAADSSLAQAFMETGTTLWAGPMPVLQATRRATVSWQLASTALFEGYVSRATTLTVALAAAPLAVTGTGVKGFTYDATSRQLRLEFGQASAFQVRTGGVLSVELIRFGARRQAAAVLLSWQTASERQNKGFTVERSLASEPGFQPLGFVPGAGSTSQSRAYSYPDLTAPAKLAYYRLRQHDLNGTVTYSPVVAVAAQAMAPRLEAAPNPARTLLLVSWSSPVPPGAQLRLLNPAGQTVLHQPFRQQAWLDVRSLPPGLYFLQLLDAAGRYLAKAEKVLIAP